MFTRHVLFSTLAVIACAVPASATISYYTDAGTFAADNVSAQSISFDGSLGQTFASFSDDGFTFTSSSTLNSNLTVSANPGGSWPTSPTTDVLAQVSSGGFSNGSLLIALPANVFAVEFYTSYAIAGDDLAVTLTAGGALPTLLTNTTPTGPKFFGARSDQAITSISLSRPSSQNLTFGYAVQLGELQFDTVSGSDSGSGGGSAPEPATFLLIGTGLVAVPLLRRRLTRA